MSDTPITDTFAVNARAFHGTVKVIDADRCREIEDNLHKAKAEIAKLKRQVEFFRKGIILRNAELKTLRKKPKNKKADL